MVVFRRRKEIAMGFVMNSAIRRMSYVVCLLSSTAALLVMTTSAAAQVPGGFVESANSTAVRPLLTTTQIQALLPPRGLFTFPAPYLTQGVRLTNATACAGGTDCVNYVGYAYWRNINNHAGSDTMLIVLTLDRSHSGTGPNLYSYNKLTDVVTNLGPLFDAATALSWASGEGWYFSATQPTKLYLNDGPRMRRYDVLSRQLDTVFDVSTNPALFGTNRYIWQMSSSNDDSVHAATLADASTYAFLGCLVYRESTKQFLYFPQVGSNFNECQIDKSGRWLSILERVFPTTSELDLRVIDLQTGTETDLSDQNGAPGHYDTGGAYMIAADNWNPLPGAWRLWKFGTTPLGPGTLLYHDINWAAGPDHISHTNAQVGVPPAQQYACGSGAGAALPRANEVLCFPLDGSLRVLIVAPVMTDMNAPGGYDSYGKLPKGNLDVTGRYFIWTSNLGGSRLDAFLVKVPAQLLSGPDVLAPTVAITAPTAAAAVTGTVTVTATAADNVGVVGVQFKLDGVNIGAERMAAPYSISWTTSAAADGTHMLTAVARDAAGNTATSAPVGVSVTNAAPTPDTTAPSVSITGPVSGRSVSGTITVAAT